MFPPQPTGYASNPDEAGIPLLLYPNKTQATLAYLSVKYLGYRLNNLSSLTNGHGTLFQDRIT